MEYILMIIGAVLVNNIILVQFLGICPFLGVSSKVMLLTSTAPMIIKIYSIVLLICD